MSQLSLSGHAALLLWLQVAALVAAARLLGAGVRRLGQPDIVGSLLAGLVLGPSVLGKLAPAAESWLFPAHSTLLGAVVGLALLVLLVVLGAEADLGLLRRLGRAAATVSASSIVVPGICCVLAAWWLADRHALAGRHPLATALAIGGALSVSSLPVVARIVVELGAARRDVGQLSLAAASLNDVYGFVLLAVVTVLTLSTGLGGILLPTLGLAGIAVALALFGQPFVDALLRRVRAHGPNVAGSLTVSLAFAFALAAATQAVHAEAALGAFAAGVVLGRSRFQHGPALGHIENFTAAFFAPLFFASAGLQMDLGRLAHGDSLGWLGLLFAVAVASKFVGAFGGAALAGLAGPDRRALGLSLNGRGAMQVIIGSAALRLGVIDTTGFTILLLVSLVSSVAIAPLLRRTIASWPGTSSEQERLAHEEQLSGNVIVRGQRLLLPTRGSANARAAALVLDRAWPRESELTMLVLADGDRPRFELPPISDRPTRTTRVADHEVVDAILAQANLGYGIIGLGAVEHPEPGKTLPPNVAAILNRSPLPLLLVRRARGKEPTAEFRCVLAAVNGSAAARAGQEVALNLGAPVHLLHVLTRPESQDGGPPSGNGRRASGNGRSRAEATTGGRAADAVLEEARVLAEAHGVEPTATSRSGLSAGAEIVECARELQADAVVLGTRVRRVGEHPFLGHSVEHVLEHGRGTTVIVVVLPDLHTVGTEPYADRQNR